MFYFRSLQNTLFKKRLWSSYRHLRLLLRHVTFAEAAPNFVSYHQDARIAGRRYGGVHREPGQEGGWGQQRRGDLQAGQGICFSSFCFSLQLCFSLSNSRSLPLLFISRDKKENKGEIFKRASLSLILSLCLCPSLALFLCLSFSLYLFFSWLACFLYYVYIYNTLSLYLLGFLSISVYLCILYTYAWLYLCPYYYISKDDLSKVLGECGGIQVMLEKLAGIVSLPTSKTLMTVSLRMYDLGNCNVFDFAYKKKKNCICPYKEDKILHNAYIMHVQYAVRILKR